MKFDAVRIFHNNHTFFFSNSNRLWHYILYVEPNPNTVVRRSTKINYHNRTYELEGFSVFFHKSLPSNFPQTPLSKWTNEYSIKFMEENFPEVDLFYFDSTFIFICKYSCPSCEFDFLSYFCQKI